MAHPDVRGRLDRDQILHMLGGLFMPGASMFEGIRQVPPGCVVRIEDGRVETRRYWRLNWSPDVDPAAAGRDDASIVEEFDARLAEAVHLRLHGDVEAGVYLSGGIDSGVVAQLMTTAAPGRVRAFTVGFADPHYDETSRAVTVAEATGLEHHVARLGPGGLADCFAQTLWHTEQPIVNAHASAKFVLSELAAQHVKVVLTGEGADELLAGYAQFRHQDLLDARRRDPDNPAHQSALRAFLDGAGALGGTVPIQHYRETERVAAHFGTYPYQIAKALYYQQRLWALLSTPLRRQARAMDSLEALAALIDRGQLSGRPAVTASQQILFDTELPGYILSVLGDRAEMAHAIEGRTPFLDHPLVEFVASLPVRYRLRGATDKWLLRRVAERRLPQAAAVPKRVFLAPSLSTFALDRRNSPLDMYLTRQCTKEAGIFNPAAIAAVRLGARLLRAGSRPQAVCEAATVLAASVHALNEMYCGDFGAALVRYRRPGTIDAAALAAALSDSASDPGIAVFGDGSSSSGQTDSAMPSRPATAATIP